jgi:hypothetical protein
MPLSLARSSLPLVIALEPSFHPPESVDPISSSISSVPILISSKEYNLL